MSFSIGFKHDVAATTVSTRHSWADSWTAQPYLYVDSLNYAIGGAFGRATLRREYGRIKRPDSQSFAIAAKLDLDRYYIRIAYTPNTTGASEQYWYGVVISESDDRVGNDSGNQTLTAITLDWLLTQKQITSSWVADGGGKKLVSRPIAFNAAEGDAAAGPQKAIGNRSPSPGPDHWQWYLFAEDLSNAEKWTSADILAYITSYFPPEDGSGPKWSINMTAYDCISWITPAIVTDGRTLHDIINALVDTRRGIAWYVDVSESGCELRICSYSSTPIGLPSGATIPANSPTAVTLDDELQVDRVVTITDSQQQYSQVRVTGARRGACFTIGVPDGTMLSDWTDADEADYLAGDPTAGGTTLAEDKAKHDAFRTSDAMQHVYTRFRLVDDWDGKAGNGISFAPSQVCPSVDPFTGSIAGSGEPFWQTGLRFRKNLPFLQFHDYEQSIETPTDNTPTGSNAGPLRSFACANIGGTLMLTHELQTWAMNEMAPAGGTEMASFLVVSDEAPVVTVRPQSMPHAQADAEGTAGIYPGSDVPTIIEWQTLICTVFAEFDTLVEAVWPNIPNPEVNDQVAILTLRLGERARMDYVPRGTVLGTRDGSIVMAQQDGFVRNDHELLRDIARVAWEWYSVSRKALRIRVNHVSSELAIGALVGTLDGVTVDSLVTGVGYDFTRGTTNITTQFVNLDARRLVG